MDITRAADLPELPTVIAADMLHAQGYTPTAEERAAIVARGDFFAQHGVSRLVRVPVRDFNGLLIGSLDFPKGGR